MARNAICKSKGTAVQIIRTVAENMKDGMQKDALLSAAEWVQETVRDLPNDPAERSALAHKLWTDIKERQRSSMSIAERRAEAAFFLEGIETDEKKKKKKGVSGGV